MPATDLRRCQVSFLQIVTVVVIVTRLAVQKYSIMVVAAIN
jgi:hypothetical protein